MGPSMPFSQEMLASGVRIAALCLSLLAGLGMLAFAGVLLLGRCGACASALPPAIVAVGALSWLAVAALIGGHRLGWACLSAVIFGSAHAFLIAFLNARPCFACLVFLTIESVAAIRLVVIQIPRLRAGSRSQFLLRSFAVAGSVLLGAGIAGLFYWDASSRPAVVLKSSDATRDLKAYVIVRRNCPVCTEAERRIGQALEDGLPASEAIIVEEGSEIGTRLVRTLDLDTFPAFVAIRNGSVIRAQSGGSVEKFVRSLSE